MTYRELLYKAQRLINHNEITLGEYDEMTKPLDEEVRKVGKWIDGHCTNCGCDVPAYINDWKWEKDMNAKWCPQCGAEMRGGENDTRRMYK